MNIHNMLLQAGVPGGIKHFHIEWTDGKLPSPWTWNGLCLAPDQGPDNMCFDSFSGNHKNLNIWSEWDLRHGTNNSAKNALKENGHWRQIVLWTSSENCVYGSTLSPPRLQQIQETCNELFQIADPPNDELYQHWLPYIIAANPQWGLTTTTPNVDQAGSVAQLGLAQFYWRTC